MSTKYLSIVKVVICFSEGSYLLRVSFTTAIHWGQMPLIQPRFLGVLGPLQKLFFHSCGDAAACSIWPEVFQCLLRQCGRQRPEVQGVARLANAFAGLTAYVKCTVRASLQGSGQDQGPGSLAWELHVEALVVTFRRLFRREPFVCRGYRMQSSAARVCWWSINGQDLSNGELASCAWNAVLSFPMQMQDHMRSLHDSHSPIMSPLAALHRTRYPLRHC